MQKVWVSDLSLPLLTVPPPDRSLSKFSTSEPWLPLSEVAVPNDTSLSGCSGHQCAYGCESILSAGRWSVSVCDCPWPWMIRPQLCVLCLAEGCPGLCNGNGRCTLDLNGWHCVCQLGWRGAGCDTSMETACGDSKDNDGGKAVAPMSPMQLGGALQVDSGHH